MSPIRTPTPRRGTTLLGGLANVGRKELEDRRAMALETEERERRRELEDLAIDKERTEAVYRKQEHLRNVFGVEEVQGTSTRIQETPQLPSGPLAPTHGGGGDVGVRAELPAARAPLEGPPAGRVDPGVSRYQKLEPARDPSIVNPELMDRPTADFGELEDSMGVPRGSITGGYKDDPSGMMNSVLDHLKESGGGSAAARTQARLAVSQAIDAIRVQVEFGSMSVTQENEKMAEIEDLYQGLLDMELGPAGGWNEDAGLTTAEAAYPDDPEQAADYYLRLRRRHQTQGRFTNRRPLEPR